MSLTLNLDHIPEPTGTWTCGNQPLIYEICLSRTQVWIPTWWNKLALNPPICIWETLMLIGIRAWSWRNLGWKWVEALGIGLSMMVWGTANLRSDKFEVEIVRLEVEIVDWFEGCTIICRLSMRIWRPYEFLQDICMDLKAVYFFCKLYMWNWRQYTLFF